MNFAKEPNKRGLKKMQANNTKAMSAHAEAIKTLVKPKIPKDQGHKLNQLACIGKCTCAHVFKGLSVCWSKSKAKTQSKAQDATAAPAQAPVQLWLSLPKLARP